MKKMIMVIGLLIFGLLLTYYEINSIRAVNENALTEVVALKKSLESGIAITMDDLKYVLVDSSFDTKQYFEDDKELIGKKLSVALGEDTLLMNQFIKQEGQFSLEKNHAITSLKVLPEEFICWQVDLGDSIELVHVSLDYEMTQLGEVVIKGIFDQNLKSHASMPTYVVIEGKSSTIEKIILLRDQGRIEAIKR